MKMKNATAANKTLKATLGLVAILFTAHANASLICDKPGATNLIVTTDESVSGELVSIRAEGAFLPKPVTFAKESGDLLQVDREVSESAEGTAYMAASPQKQIQLLLSMPEPIAEGKSSEATVFISYGAHIVTEVLNCKDDSSE